MKKLFIACAILLAGIFTSCGDTNYCYEITTTFTILGWEKTSVTTEWITSNELDARIAEIKKNLVEEYGLSEETINVTYQKLNKSQADCVVEE
jgi:ABC-type proline/glycine betaine transport system substrate-binding protein